MTEAEKTRFDQLTFEEKVRHIEHLWKRIAGEAEARPEDEDFDRLNRSEQIEHVQCLWDRISGQELDGLELTDPQRRELERRLAAHEADPSRASSWDEVKRRILDGA